MKTKLTLLIFMIISIKSFSQSKIETVKQINHLLAKAVGGSDTISIKGKTSAFVIKSNTFAVDADGKSAHFTVKMIGHDGFESSSTTTSIISDWKGFKINPAIKSRTLKSVYPVFQKRKNEPDNDKNGIKHYCIAGDEKNLIASLAHLESLYSKSK